MCGIATIIIGRRARNRIPYRKLRALSTQLLTQLQVRGIDAAGMAVINEPEGSVLFKKPLRPERLVVRPRFDDALNRIGPNTNFILLHSRAATIGGTGDNYDNHPIVAAPCVGIHNGTLYNHEELFEAFSESFSPQGSVDSEVIFRLYHHFTDNQGLDPQKAIQATAHHLQGAYTGALVDMRHLNRMVMFKNGRSLCMVRIPFYDIIIMVSEGKFYEQASKKLGIKARTSTDLILDDTGFVFDVNVNHRITEGVEDFDLPAKAGVGMRAFPGRSWLRAGNL
jgi:glucosamine 6-phosphate synthetase-like amidotransferase/phosphosugar isomerase protein